MTATVHSYYRVLTCTGCGDTVEVLEVPRGWIDPLRYKCGLCLTGSADGAQLELAAQEEIRQEKPKYDPQQSLIPI